MRNLCTLFNKYSHLCWEIFSSTCGEYNVLHTAGKFSNNGANVTSSGPRWDLSPMPTPRPMPILPRSAQASTDFQPYCSPSNLNVARATGMPGPGSITREPLNSTKATRPPSIKTNSNKLEALQLPPKRLQEVEVLSKTRESIKVKNMLTA